ncbi:hypothetical protein ANANG_G00234800 [Anguilla anguilla]|uniref:Rho guanine nucleotide exchange factor 26 n=1 Tax=Anguilla anguilla TaxID=7936 RepID=A0A9D3LU25_ANGAN|nr:hypothetical protein ANANG_G00234800 [Anguilla anguilla]
MEGGNDVDLSNNNITPRWKKRPVNGAVSSRPNPRPLSGQTAGVLTEDKSAFTLSQPAEKIVASPGSTAVLKHVLNKPSRKARVVRSISIGHLSNGRFTLSKLKSEGDKPSTDNRAHHDVDGAQTGNGVAHRQDRRPPCDRHRDVQKRLSSPMTLTSQTDQIVFGSSPSDTPLWKTSSPTNSYGHLDVVLLRQTSGPSQGPDSKPQPTFVLSTHSPVAQKMGTQQLIPRGLASDVRLCKTAQGNHGNHGNVGQLEPSKRALRAISMVETGSYFSTGWGDAEVDPNGDGDGDSPGMLRRGLRSTSYRRAVVSGVDMEVPKTDPKAHRLSQPVLRGLPVDKEQPSSPGKGKSNEKKKGLQPQRTFDNEEDEVLYQNYKEKALHNDSDEDAEAREPKPDDRIVVQYRPIRTSWSQLSVVKKSGISQNLTPEERKRQEAIFEVISSEHSYLHSLEILVRMFKNSTELSDTMTKTDSHHLFSNIVDVCEASKKFFSDLEDRHQQNFLIDDISDIVIKHAHSNFDPYVTYCSNEVYQQRTLQRLVTKNPSFKEVLTRIESHQDCRNLPMISFLILPMQRVTRLPLLMDTICQKTPKDSAHYDVCKKALQSVSKVVRQCNEGARRMERTEMMYTINSQLEFKIKPFPLVSSSRWMVKRGELTAFVEENGIFLKRTSRQQVYFFLFNDVLIITRKKSEDSYAVMDYALRDQIAVGPCQAEDLNLSPVRTTAGMLTSRQSVPSHLFRLVFRSVHSGEKVPMVLGAELMNERARWISALGQSGSNRKDADRTNVMQVEIIRTYTARQPDELSLQVADVVLVSQAVEDGWYEGDRLRDGERGWFLAECAQKITCQATIEKNMQRMDRLQGLETNV